MLGRIAWRIATIEAIKGNTLVGGNVLDSQIAALDVGADGTLRTDQERPFVAVYTDGASIREGLTVRELHRCGDTDLTIESGVTASMTVTDEETGVSQVIPGLPATDRDFEFFLDCVGRQIVNCLSDPDNPWAEIWRGLTSGIRKIERKRTSDAASGTRIAAHQLIISGELLPDPVFGEPLKGTWVKLFALMEEKGHPYLTLMRELVQPAGSEAHGQQRRFGLTLEEMHAQLLTRDGVDGGVIASVGAPEAQPVPGGDAP